MISPRIPWSRLEEVYRRQVDAELADYPYRNEKHRLQDRDFHAQRLEEGHKVGDLLIARLGRPVDVLDLGAGNGGVAIGLANHEGLRVVALDKRFGRSSRDLSLATGIRLNTTCADGVHLPFRDESFDAVSCLEILEHVGQPERFASEISRILKPGGVCVLTTPARLRFLFRRDPHFAIPGLLLLPDRLQKWVATRMLRRVSTSNYDVEHIYSYAGSILRFFPGSATLQAVGRPPENPAARRLWSFTQRFLWERLVVEKV